MSAPTENIKFPFQHVSLYNDFTVEQGRFLRDNNLISFVTPFAHTVKAQLSPPDPDQCPTLIAFREKILLNYSAT